jgi:small GTP-binding protein
MRKTVLNQQQAQFLREEKDGLSKILVALSKLELAGESLDTLQKAILQLDELFLIVIAGEFNAGKSALINALLGEKVLAEGATPTTSRVTLIKWGETVSERIVDEGFATFTHPLPLLKELNIVDTPGTNAIIRRHERLTDDFIPRSDLVLFVTSADHPLTESERGFLERILAWGKKIVFVLNKVDIFENSSALQEVGDFILKNTTSMLGETPRLVPVSARLAQRAALEQESGNRAQLRRESRLDDLEDFINDVLEDQTRLRLKFTNPLGVAEHFVEQGGQSLSDQKNLLKEDKVTSESLETVIREYERDLNSELPPRLAEVENILHRLEQRGLDFFDSTMRLTNVQNLIRGDKVRAIFEKQVLADVPHQIEEQVQRLIDWLVQKDLHEWQQVMSYLQRRRAQNLDHLVGEGIGPREARRRELIDTVGKSVQSIVNSYDRDREASELAASVEAAVAQTALLEAGAVGLGAIISVAVLSSTLDITGILAASSMAILGFFVIPFKRRKAKENFKEKMQHLRSNLIGSLTSQFTSEKEGAITRLKEGIAPYTRYVHSEMERIGSAEKILSGLRQTISALRSGVEAVVK